MPELPEDTVEEVERLTRLARDAVDDAAADAYRAERDELLDEHGYTARHREADDTLVLHPKEWLDDAGTVRMDAVDTEEAVELSLSGPGDAAAYRETAEQNAAIVDAVAEKHGETHAANVRTLADFAENHYAKPIGDLASEEVEEFAEEYFPRNAWPTDEQRELLEQSLEYALKEAETVGSDDVRTSD
ncbi:DUF7108 family protein [Halocalculus aciditolerans]|uniref:RnhA operon protein n=1 Tax=Halocalculus aciditolerans TaxID=1383812 RepID=A0A830FG38_9EURY|nr:rnhA operon protein [Halocalculus aciditolerans]GGL72107.1 hypothetical protein GCM10009039_32700 [Halocalculus aciditolerans]